MKTFNKFVLTTVATFALSSNVFANTNELNTQELQTEIAANLALAISDINQPKINKVAKLHLDQMNFKQNVEQFLVIARYNTETKTATPQIVAE